MDNQHNTYNFELEFKTYLIKHGYGSATVKNYSLDLRSFLLWIAGSKHEPPSVGLLQQSLTAEGIDQYLLALRNKHTQQATIDRHMASIRSFWSLAYKRQWVEGPPSSASFGRDFGGMSKPNSAYFVDQFEKWLKKEKVAAATIHSYMADVKEYLTIISSKQNS